MTHGVARGRAHVAVPAGAVALAVGRVEPEACELCGKPMQLKRGRFGPFLGCTGYPECKTIVDPKKKDLPPPDPEFSMPCPRPGCAGEVVNGNCQAHEIRNLFLADGAPFVSQADKNPTWTIMALAWRSADYMLAAMKRREL